MEQALDLELTVQFTRRDGEWFAAMGGELDGLSLEELAVTLSVGEVFMEVDHDYPDLNVHLMLFNAEIREGTPRMLEHNDIRWITTEEIPQYGFCPADETILKKLRSESAAR